MRAVLIISVAVVAYAVAGGFIILGVNHLVGYEMEGTLAEGAHSLTLFVLGGLYVQIFGSLKTALESS